MLNNIFDNFLATHPVFNKDRYSEVYRESLVRPLQGLGLPTPIYGKRAPFGYEKIGDAFMPIESDLQILHAAHTMCNSPEYYLDDVIDWFNAAPLSKPLSRRAFIYIRELRPPFPELALPPEERLKIFYGIAPITS